MLGVLAVLVAAPGPAAAVIPSAESVRREIARTNRQAGRSQPLVLEVAVIGEAGEPVASGRAILDPARPSRLQLTLADGRHELHERSGERYTVTRDGVPVERAMPLLPPFALLQAGSEAEVAAALVALGGEPERVDLGMEGNADCWVLGGRDPGPFDHNGRCASTRQAACASASEPRPGTRRRSSSRPPTPSRRRDGRAGGSRCAT